MVALAVLLLVIILILLLSFKGSTNRKLEQLEQEVKLLRKELAQSLPPTVTTISTTEKKPAPTVIQPEQKEEWTSSFKVVTDPSVTFKKEDWLSKEEPVQKQEPAVVYTKPEPQPVKEEPFVLSSKATIPVLPPKPPKP